MFNPYLKMLRINHWFKNIFVVFGAVSALYLSDGWNLNRPAINIGLAFLLASVISSVNYVINQITDAEFDRLHPIKKTRPVPSGRVSIGKAFIFSMVLFFISFICAVYLYDVNFSIALMSLWVAGLTYNVKPIRLKDVPFVDVVNESINNPIRFLVGWYAVGSNSVLPVNILILTWLGGALLMTSKRYDELFHFGTELIPYRNTFKRYTLSTLRTMIFVYAILTLLFAYLSLKAYVHNYNYILVLGIGFLIWMINEVLTGRAEARSVEKFVLSKKFILITIGLLIVAYMFYIQ